MNHSKEIWIVGVASLLTVLVFVGVGVVANDPTPLTVAAIGVLALGWAALMACAYAMLHNWRVGRYVLSGVAAVSAAIAGLFSAAALVGGILLFAFITSAAHLIASATRDRIAWRIRPALLPGLRVIIAGMAVAAAALVLPAVREYVTGGGAAVPTETVAFTLRPMAALIENFLPGYTPTSTVDELVEVQIQEQAAALPAGYVIEAGQKEILRRELARSTGLDITGGETVADLVAQYMNQYVRDLGQESGVLVIVVLAIIALLAIRALVPPVAWVALGVAVIIFWIARAAGVVHIVPTQMPVERLQL